MKPFLNWDTFAKFTRLCSAQDRYVAAERLSTVALVVLGSMAVAETTLIRGRWQCNPF